MQYQVRILRRISPLNMYVLVHTYALRDSQLVINLESWHAFVNLGASIPVESEYRLCIPENEHDQILEMTIADNDWLLSHKR